MASSPVTIIRVGTVIPDETPGAPFFAETPVQQGNVILCKVVMPLQDVIGPTLTGLTHRHIATAQVVGGVGAMDGLTGPEIAASGVHHVVASVTPANAGETFEDTVPVLGPDGSDQDIAIWVDDDAS